MKKELLQEIVDSDIYGLLDTEKKVFTPKVGGQSPWGKIQYIHPITPWLVRVGTASHGGYKLDRAYNSAIPAYLRKAGGWYEEDCEWSIIFCVLENLIKRDAYTKQHDRLWDDSSQTFKYYYPDLYLRYISNE